MTKQQEALAKIATTPKGEDRAKLLQDEAFRSLLLNSGANVTFFSGEIKSANSFKEALEDVFVGLIQRKNRQGKLDGLGALGGLAERTTTEQFESLSPKDKEALVGHKDDILVKQGIVHLTNDMDIIRQNNVLREMREELNDLGIDNITIDPLKLHLVKAPKVKDDNYIINIWDGKGACFAVTPYCHLYKVDVGLLDRIAVAAKEKNGGEATSFNKIPLFQTLSAYGNTAGKDAALEDGRSATKDYRYPHEYLAVWYLACQLLEYKSDKFLQLTQEVQKSVSHPISFMTLARATNQTLGDIAEVLRIPLETLQQSDELCSKIISDKQIAFIQMNMQSNQIV